MYLHRYLAGWKKIENFPGNGWVGTCQELWPRARRSWRYFARTFKMISNLYNTYKRWSTKRKFETNKRKQISCLLFVSEEILMFKIWCESNAIIIVHLVLSANWKNLQLLRLIYIVFNWTQNLLLTVVLIKTVSNFRIIWSWAVTKWQKQKILFKSLLFEIEG